MLRCPSVCLSVYQGHPKGYPKINFNWNWSSEDRRFDLIGEGLWSFGATKTQVVTIKRHNYLDIGKYFVLFELESWKERNIKLNKKKSETKIFNVFFYVNFLLLIFFSEIIIAVGCLNVTYIDLWENRFLITLDRKENESLNKSLISLKVFKLPLWNKN